MRTRRQRFDPATLLIALCWAVVVIPRLLQTFTAPKYRTAVSAQVPYSRISTASDHDLTLLLIALCLVIILRSARNLPSSNRFVLLCLLMPWGFMVSRDLYLTGRPHLDGMVYPVLVLAVWVLRPRLDKLRILGLLVGATALLSVLMGALTPAKGIFSASSGGLIAPEKQILPWGILVGPFTDSNNLGQFLVLGLPAVLLIRSRLLRAGIVVVTVFAIVWTSSRSSIAAVLLGGVTAVVLALIPPHWRRLPTRLILLTSSAVLVIIPVTAQADNAFTNRGYIWRMSLHEWRDNLYLGHGSAWYTSVAKYANSLGGNAFHGHNQFVQTVVVGGLWYLVLTVTLIAVLILAAGNWARRAVDYPAVFLIMFLTSCTLEVSFGVVDRSFLIAVTVLPMAFIAMGDPEPKTILIPSAPPRAVARRPVPAR